MIYKILLLLVPFLLFAFSGCSKNNKTEDELYLTRTDWAPDVKIAINDLIKTYRNTGNKYVVFDFDNTSSIFDIEEQLMIYQIETMSFALNPSELKSAISTGLENRPEASFWIEDIITAYEHLYNSYGPFTPMGLSTSIQEKIQSDPQWMEFGTKICALYKKVGDWLSTEESYNWILYMFAGMTDSEVYNLSYASCSKYSAVVTTSEIWESPSSISSHTGQVNYSWTRGVSVTENIKELFEAFDYNDIDVWICSASGIQQVLAAVDAMGLHSHCTGVLGMTLKKADDRYICEYDFENGTGYITDGSTAWKRHSLVNKAQTAGPDKVKCIINAIAPLYNEEGPLAGFMDSTGDFNFCTEFSSLKLVTCFNRGDRKITDGGGLIAIISMYEKDNLGYDLSKANANGNTLYLLQGRDENGLRSFRSSNSTIRLNDSEEKLFANEDCYNLLDEIANQKMTVKDALNKYSSLFLDNYPGYHSR